MALSDVSRPLAQAAPDARVAYLQRVLLWTTGGLAVAGVTGVAMAAVLWVVASAGFTMVLGGIPAMIGILGCFFVAQSVARRMVFGQAKVAGFLVGAVFQGLSMGWLLLSAVLIGLQTGQPFGLISMAMGLTALTAGGMTAYVWTGPREFSMLGAGLSALGIPMLILMVASFAFPGFFGGTLGLVLTAVFVLVSAGGLLYQINQVVHKLRTDQHVEGAYMITLSVLVLFWNLLSLLMRLNRR